jgi:cobyrinic acid a,c-diamide synthase
MWQQGSVRASYFHAWFPSCPQAVAELFSPPAKALA